ncbi:MAG: hypothetical protein ABI282_06970 [Candidatus Baltobacteraceae bacterium]
MDTQISGAQLATFFATAPIILLLAIFFTAWIAKRNEGNVGVVNVGTTFACAKCGRRGAREHMVPQAHEGAVSWYCTRCAGLHS